jgi:hypothetical protein
MAMTRDEIIDYATRYLSADEILPFPMDGELFCLLERELVTDRILTEEEGWQFNGYSICMEYELDTESKPKGKWIWFRFLSLATFPPQIQTLKLQPPHIGKGRFSNAERTRETRVITIPVTFHGETPLEEPELPPPKAAGKILRFPPTQPGKSLK